METETGLKFCCGPQLWMHWFTTFLVCAVRTLPAENPWFSAFVSYYWPFLGPAVASLQTEWRRVGLLQGESASTGSVVVFEKSAHSFVRHAVISIWPNFPTMNIASFKFLRRWSPPWSPALRYFANEQNTWSDKFGCYSWNGFLYFEQYAIITRVVWLCHLVMFELFRIHRASSCGSFWSTVWCLHEAVAVLLRNGDVGRWFCTNISFTSATPVSWKSTSMQALISTATRLSRGLVCCNEYSLSTTTKRLKFGRFIE